MFRKSIAIAACLFGTSMTANATTAYPVVQVTGNLTGVIQTTKDVTGKQAGSPHVFQVPVSKSISLSINALVNLAQGFPINAVPAKNVTLGFSCGDDNLVVVTKIPGAKPQSLSDPATLIDSPPATHYIPVSDVIEPVPNGVTNPSGLNALDIVRDDLLFTPPVANTTSIEQLKDYLALEQIPAPAFGVPSVGTAPTGIQPLIGVTKLNYYTGDPSKIPTVTDQCSGLKSQTLSNLHGAIVAKPDGVTTTLIVITGGSLSVGNTLLGYH